MIQPMVYGYPSEYSNDNFSNYFDWTTNNKGMEVIEMITSSNDMAYGIGYSEQKDMKVITSVKDVTAVLSNNPWKGAVVHPNGKVYFFPCDDITMMEYEPISETVTRWGNVGSTSTDKLTGGVLYPDGMMYSLPSAGFSVGYGVVKYNPYLKTISIIGAGLVGVNTRGSIVHPNGNIYGVPDRDGVLVFDPRSNKWYDFGAATIGTGATYWGGCLHPNGKIYCPTYTPGIEGVIEIDVDTEKINFISCFPQIVANNSLFKGIVLAPNKLMYAIPHSSERIMEVNPYTRTCRPVGVNINALTGITTGKFATGCLGADGYIYMMPSQTGINSVLKFDWRTYNCELIPITGINTARGNKIDGSVLAFDGCIYGAPSSTAASTVQIVKFDFGVGVKDGVYCREVNKY